MQSSDAATVDPKTHTSDLWRVFGKPTQDELTNARLSGIEIGMQEYDKFIQIQHLNLREKAFRISEEIYSRLKLKFSIEPLGMRMRAQGFSSFGTLFMLRPDDFYSEKIEEIYRFMNEEQERISDIRWSFAIMPAVDELDESAIRSDGYIHSYVRPA